MGTAIISEAKPDASGLYLLPADALIATSDVDHADWNFRPLVGNVIRLRYEMLQKILANRHFGSVLEIGYGSGVFMPHLARQTDHLYGIDPHPRSSEVTAVLNRFGVSADLVTGSATEMPYPDQSFDLVLAASAMEFIDDLPKACREILRVLRPGGVAAVVTPGESPLLDFGLKILTGASPKKDFGDRRKSIIPTLLEHFELRQRLDRPRYLHRVVRLYTAFELAAKSSIPA
jgi:SAM-dependent methyltransferase